MHGASNQDLERYYFEQFRSCFTLPDGEVCYGDKPDVVISSCERVGIEIANVYVMDGKDAASEQAQRPKREAAIKRAQYLHESAGGRKIELSVDFNPAFPIDNISDVATKLAAVALEVDGKMKSQFHSIVMRTSPPKRISQLRSTSPNHGAALR